MSEKLLLMFLLMGTLLGGCNQAPAKQDLSTTLTTLESSQVKEDEDVLLTPPDQAEENQAVDLTETTQETSPESDRSKIASDDNTASSKKKALQKADQLKKAIIEKKKGNPAPSETEEDKPLVDPSARDYSQYQNVEEVIEALITEYQFPESNLGIAYQNYKTKESYFLNADTALHAASTNKVGTAVLFVDQIEAGQLDWNSQLPASEDLIEAGGGNITNNPLQASYSLEDLISNLLIYSDNTAWNILIQYYSNHFGDYQADLIRQSGIQVQPPALSSQMNFATPNMLLGYLHQIAKDDRYQKLVGFMSQAQEGQRFKLYVPEGMATKYGQYGYGYHDMGIYFEDGQPIYSLVLMSYDLGMIDSFMGELNLCINQWYHYQVEQKNAQ